MSIKKLLKVKRGLASLNDFRIFVGNEVFLNAVKNDFLWKVLDDLSSGRVLVLAPHPDDDILGCGGVILKHKKAGANVKIVFITDGSGGSEIKITTDERKKLIAIREEEAREAARVVGAKDLEFWKCRDSELVLSKALVKLLTTLIGTFSPEVIYTPSFLDPHPDHRETAKIFATALKGIKNFNGHIFSYETWLPVYVNRLVVIDNEIKEKSEALRKHKSQLKCKEYLEGILGLNRYRGGMFGAGKYAEGFFEADRKLYLQLFEISNYRK